MKLLWLGLALLGQAAATHMTGTVRVVGPAQTPAILLRVDNHDVSLAGALLPELARLASAKVDLAGSVDAGGQLNVSSYRILAVSGNSGPPRVGLLVQAAGQLALQEDGLTTLPLLLPKGARTRLADSLGAKLWVYGQIQADGSLQVSTFGLLRRANTAP